MKTISYTLRKSVQADDFNLTIDAARTIDVRVHWVHVRDGLLCYRAEGDPEGQMTMVPVDIIFRIMSSADDGQ